jgi:hypothetical protein
MAALTLNTALTTGAINWTTLGVLDWFGYDNSGALQRKSSGSLFTLAAIAGGYTGAVNTQTETTKSWTNGTPTASGSSVSGVYGSGTNGAGIRITIPADTTARRASILIGAFDGSYSITATLSDGSAAAVTETAGWDGSGGATDRVHTFEYAAASAGQTLTIDAVKTAGSYGPVVGGGALEYVAGGGGTNATTTTVSVSATSGATGTPVTVTVGTDSPLTGAQSQSVTLSSNVAGSFSVNPVTINASTATATSVFTPSATGTATITATGSGTPTLTAGTATYTVTGAVVSVPYNDAAIFFSPYTWDDRGTAKVANSPGSYIRLAFTGTSVAVKFDVSAAVSASLSAGSYPIVQTVIDGKTANDTQLTSSTTAVTVSGLSAGSHTIDVFFRAAEVNSERWNTPVSALYFNGFTLDSGATYSAPTLRSKRMMYFGDSITEGYFVAGQSNPGSNNALQTVPPQLAAALGAEYGQLGYSAQGYAAAGVGNVPVFNTAIPLYAAGRSKLLGGLFSPAPDYIFVEHGTNGSTSSADVQTAITTLRSAAPSAKIFVMVPANGMGRAGITAGVAAKSSDNNLFVIDLGAEYQIGMDTWGAATQYATDGVHRNLFANAKVAAGYTAKVQAVLDGVGATKTARTVTLTLNDRSGSPRANLSGLKWAFFDAITPNLVSAPASQGSAATTNASGVLTLAVQTTLASGATGWLVLSDSAGNAAAASNAFSGPVTVS